MKKLVLTVGTLALLSTAAFAADDPVKVRQLLMTSNAGGAGLAGAMMKGEMDYNPMIAKAAITAMNATSHAFGDFFPEGSTGENSKAAPAIWEDPDGWQEELAKFQSATEAAAEAAGKDGPADLDAFKAAAGPVFNTCKSCHETYQLER